MISNVRYRARSDRPSPGGSSPAGGAHLSRCWLQWAQVGEDSILAGWATSRDALDQQVAQATPGNHEPRVLRLFLDLLPEPTDVRLDVAGLASVAGPPDLPQNLSRAHRPPDLARKAGQQPELSRRQADLLATHPQALSVQ